MDSRRLARVPILVIGVLPNHTAWNCLSSVCISLGIPGLGAGPPRTLHHAILLAFSVDLGVRALNADGLCIPIAVAAQRKQPTLPMRMRMRHYICFSLPRSSREDDVSASAYEYTEYGLHIPLHSASLIKAKPSDGEVHGLQGIFRWFTSLLCYTAEACPDPGDCLTRRCPSFNGWDDSTHRAAVYHTHHCRFPISRIIRRIICLHHTLACSRVSVRPHSSNQRSQLDDNSWYHYHMILI
jgi:hypothetical protein